MSLRNVIKDMRKEIDELYAKANRGVAAVNALSNSATTSFLSPTTPSAATITPFVGAKLTSRASGLFLVSLSARAAAVAADVVTWTVESWTDTVAGVPLTLPANATLVAGSGRTGSTGGIYYDNSGAGIVPSAGATGVVVASPAKTLGTLEAGNWYQFSNELGLALASTRVPLGSTMYVTLAITDTVAARALVDVAASIIELP